MKKNFLVFQLLISFMYSPAADTTTVLKYIVRQPKVSTPRQELIILLHGLGSNERDLFQFADQLPAEALVISVRAPITLSEGSYAWFHVDLSTGKRVINAADAEQSRKTFIRFIGELKSIYTFDPAKIYLCGFSQGAILSYSVGLTQPDLVHGIGILSGRLLDEVKPGIASQEKLKNLHVFVSHGKSDDVVPVDLARNSVLYLRKTLNIEVDYHEYNAAHQITPQMLEDFLNWLKKN